jgi:hypothetical protein
MAALSESQKPDRFQVVMAVLIALVTLIGAALASRAALVSSLSGDADFAGVAASLNAEEALAVNTTTMYGNYRAYTAYVRYNELGNLISNDLENVTDETKSAQLTSEMNTDWSLAVTVNDFFPARYLNRDGNYDTEREMGESWAEAAMKNDVYPEPYFAAADALRLKASHLLTVIILFIGAVWFFSLAQGLRHPVRYVLAIGGLGLALLAAALAVIEEVLR